MAIPNFFFVPTHNTGAHFVIWSTYWLSGQDHYYNLSKIHDLATPEQMISKEKNAHRHRAVAIGGAEECQAACVEAASIPLPQWHVHVTANERNNLFKLCQTLFGQNLPTLSADIRAQFEQNLYENNKTTIEFLQSSNHKLIWLEYDPRDRFNLIYNDRHPTNVFAHPVASTEEAWLSYQNYYFANSAKNFGDQFVWDRREQLALILPPCELRDYHQFLDHSRPHLRYNTDDLWHDLPSVMAEIIDYIGLEVKSDRLDRWLPAYHAWSTKHDCFFSRHLDRIVKAIVHNQYMCLKRFRLDLLKEAMIQHTLIFKHDLNLKNWNLDKFPNDTQKLHHLLEPNIHKISRIY